MLSELETENHFLLASMYISAPQLKQFIS